MADYKQPQPRFVLLKGTRATTLVRRLLAKTVPAAVVDNIDRMAARMVSLHLSRGRTFEQSSECQSASTLMSVVVPIHDAPFVTKRCLASLERYGKRAEIILVDDGSRLPETAAIIREFSNRNGWNVISNARAGGHSAACREGARVASRPYLCLLNSDTVVTPWCWRGIQRAFAADSSIGAVGPSTSYSGNQQALNVAIYCRSHWNDSQICAFAERLMAVPLQPELFDLSWISGFAFFIRRNLWEQLGGFDQHLPDYGNEVELCRRVTKSGYRIVWVRTAYIHHLGQLSYRATMGQHEISQRKVGALRYIVDIHNWQPSDGSPAGDRPAQSK